MPDNIVITGLVATSPRHIVTSEGLAITSFRLASNQRKFDRSKEKWIDADTNWYTVTTFRQLALNSAKSITKGDRIIVSGRLRIRDWGSGERNGTSVEIDADAVGHDLNLGVSKYSRSQSNATQNTETFASEDSNQFLPDKSENLAQQEWAATA